MSLIDRILLRRSHYRSAFQTESGRKVLADLRRFCGYGASPLQVSAIRQETDVSATMVKIGRQEVFQRIIAHLGLDDADLIRLKEDDYVD